jgi:hypothetical protein
VHADRAASWGSNQEEILSRKDILSFSTANALSLISTLACRLTYARFSFEKLSFLENCFLYIKNELLKRKLFFNI